ncbi:histidine--tRNA ligase, partial [Ruminococcaceae bacterium OttesenSCG-928-D13]|nr:histidine--tRNA ligase [Ruminococcaceae bacterium OttesenSCG-928-D13]
IRLPTFEDTALFARGVGATTDIVSKEMYTFEDKGGHSVTLRPEGTAGVVRATLENGLLASSPMPLKSYYLQSCFRYENSQKGRYREFHQFGIECFGTHHPASDVEAMAVAATLLRELGISGFVTLEINSIGCPECRPKYHAALREYFAQYRDTLCENCLNRLETNPLRILDCKEDACRKLTKNAPVMLDYLCDDCRNHFDDTKALMDEAGMDYVVNPTIVRGLDYYTNTVFEFIAEGIGTQGTVCAGGRYDGLIEELGGPSTPGAGFGMGLERLIMLLEENGKLPEPPAGPALYAVAQSEAGRKVARRLTSELRGGGIAAECDIMDRSVKAQMKAAGRLSARYTIVLGDDEVNSGIVKLKRMHDGAGAEVPLVGFVNALNYVLKQDPRADSNEDLSFLVSMAGPYVRFDGEDGEQDTEKSE